MAEAEETRPYSKREIVRAVNLSALLGWAGCIGTPVVSASILKGFGLVSSLLALFPFAFLGLPVAFLICWILVAPFLLLVMRRTVSFWRAFYWGAGIGAAIAALSIAIRYHVGWGYSEDPTFMYRIRGDGTARLIDGILTNYGWLVLAQNSTLFILICLVAALTVRAIIGPGQDLRLGKVRQ
ncbi:hypothetical protein [Ruegeria meonggei]|uniref:Uncharacterized protein n=1 Tax=Ruegeria meonggei TaxID=1446476 RepID=A0A1X6YHW1_9RHOB|nr:hypothetical protein [Ruegeria meonggei]SLN21392.1 hypothetical protein RUM8411_00777 [Ruegeria meonggei]